MLKKMVSRTLKKRDTTCWVLLQRDTRFGELQLLCRREFSGTPQAQPGSLAPHKPYQVSVIINQT